MNVSRDSILDAITAQVATLAPSVGGAVTSTKYVRKVQRSMGSLRDVTEDQQRGVAGNCPCALVGIDGAPKRIRSTIGRRVDKIEQGFKVACFADHQQSRDRRSTLLRMLEDVRDLVSARAFGLGIQPLKYEGEVTECETDALLGISARFSSRYHVDYSKSAAYDTMLDAFGKISKVDYHSAILARAPLHYWSLEAISGATTELDLGSGNRPITLFVATIDRRQPSVVDTAIRKGMLFPTYAEYGQCFVAIPPGATQAARLTYTIKVVGFIAGTQANAVGWGSVYVNVNTIGTTSLFVNNSPVAVGSKVLSLGTAYNIQFGWDGVGSWSWYIDGVLQGTYGTFGSAIGGQFYVGVGDHNMRVQDIVYELAAPSAQVAFDDNRDASHLGVATHVVFP